VSIEPEPDFESLSPAEQQAVAQRLLAIKESNWLPFWCPDPSCSGDPHWITETNADGDITNVFVSDTDIAGPNGEPLGPVVYEDSEGNWYIPEKGEPDEGDEPVGRPVLDKAWAHNHARVDQRLPSWKRPWTLFIMSGRGSGKTRTGVEFVTLNARKGLDGAILGRRGTELVNTHVAEIMKHAHPEFMPIHWASKDILEWPNGAITYLFSAEKPENIRSVNLSYAWVDEAAFMDEIETAWANLKLATRVRSPGNPIHFLITSTPTGTPWVIKMEDDPKVEVRRVSTYANRANLDPEWLADIEAEHEGTRMGRQELHGEVLRDVEGALWHDDLFEHLQLGDDPVAFIDLIAGLDDRVVAVDPAGSKGKRSDATGIIGVGAHHFNDDGSPLPGSRFFVLGDATIKGSPTEWAEQTFKMARLIKATRIVAEKNFGGDMVKQVLRDFATIHPHKAVNDDGDNMADMVEVVHAVLGKETRAEAVVGKYEQNRVTHVLSRTAFGDLSKLEKEQVTWVPKSRGGRMPSPNRIDAVVWAVKALETAVKHATTSATASSVREKMKRRPIAGPGTRAVVPGPKGRKQVQFPMGVTKKRGRPPKAA
jgi:phage terminase large subunit-like protein